MPSERPVAVFPRERGRGFNAYTLWYSTEWKGCCLHAVGPGTTDERKREAISKHKRGEGCRPTWEGGRE